MFIENILFKQQISKYLKIDITNFKLKTIYSDVGRDGEQLFQIDCSKNKNTLNQIIKAGWNKLPLSQNLELIMYGGTIKYEDGSSRTKSRNIFDLAHLNKIENGYWYFWDRSEEATNKTDDSVIFERYSKNFSLAIYNIDNDILYYYELDT